MVCVFMCVCVCVCVSVRVSLHCTSKTDKGGIVIMIMEVDIQGRGKYTKLTRDKGAALCNYACTQMCIAAVTWEKNYVHNH